jgi:hypothetical protein
MQLYEILLEGFHTPLTAAEISNLFHAGQVKRHDPCRSIGEENWHTIDDLFPLLKCNSPWRSTYPDNGPHFTRNRSEPVIWMVAALVSLGVVWFAVYNWREERATGTTPASTAPHVSSTTVPTISSTSLAKSGTTRSPVRWNQARPNLEAENAKFEQQRLAREQLQGEQAALASRMRAESQREDIQQQRSSGRSVIAPLDTSTIVDVGRSRVSVKIHDNDVTSFDVCVNGSWRRQVAKQKGISNSGTDETLLYSNGRARLYYVWEISGRLNSCLLRVREE